MLTFKLSFFYAGSVIAYHETFGSEAEETAAFVQQMCDIAEDYPDRHSIEEKCLAETGMPVPAKAGIFLSWLKPWPRGFLHLDQCGVMLTAKGQLPDWPMFRRMSIETLKNF